MKSKKKSLTVKVVIPDTYCWETDGHDSTACPFFHYKDRFGFCGLHPNMNPGFQDIAFNYVRTTHCRNEHK